MGHTHTHLHALFIFLPFFDDAMFGAGEENKKTYRSLTDEFKERNVMAWEIGNSIPRAT